MKENGKKDSNMEWEHLYITMEEATKENGREDIDMG
jgi:hypothetical protein